MTITKERLLKIQQWRETYGPGSNVVLPAEEAEELARIALASLEAEPAEWRVVFKLDGQPGSDFEKTFENQARMNEIISLHERAGFSASITPLYTDPPAPVSVPECFESLLHHAYGMTMGHDWNKGTMAGHHRTKLCQAVEECRAAMLQGAEPVSNRDELPFDYLQGHKDGLEWAAQLAEANHPQTGDWLYDDPIDLAKAIRKGPDMPEGDGNSPSHSGCCPAKNCISPAQCGNSPVIPDGWVMVPAEPTTNQWAAGMQAFDTGMDKVTRVYKAMLAAAPQKEVKP